MKEVALAPVLLGQLYRFFSGVDNPSKILEFIPLSPLYSLLTRDSDLCGF